MTGLGAEIHRACAGRSATANHQTTAHTKGGMPCITSTQRQVPWSSIHPDSGAISTEESGRHAIHSALARARSRSGNHEASRMRTAGQTPPSKTPRTKRAT